MNWETYVEKAFISHSHGGWEVHQDITRSNDFPKAPPPKLSSGWGLRFQHINLDYKGKEAQIFRLATWEAYV